MKISQEALLTFHRHANPRIYSRFSYKIARDQEKVDLSSTSRHEPIMQPQIRLKLYALFFFYFSELTRGNTVEYLLQSL